MKIHHLNCATMCPIGRRLINGNGSYLEPAKMVCHVLLIETGRQLALVDTGLGTLDVADPAKRLGKFFVSMASPVCREEETALRQVEALGFDAKDVRHIVLTHLDVDHTGGISDFPWAMVHTTATEKEAADNPQGMEKARYRRSHWKHRPEWNRGEVGGEPWYGFDAVRDLPGLPPEILMIPTPGHTRGHAAIAVNGPAGWMLHCGDAYFYDGEMDVDHPHCTPGLRFFQRMVAVDNAKRLHNRDRLRELKREHGTEITLFSAHSPVEFDALRTRGAESQTARAAQADAPRA